MVALARFSLHEWSESTKSQLASWAAPAVTAAALGLIYYNRRAIVVAAYNYVARSRVKYGQAYLEGNYGPVGEEVHCTDLEVVGHIPKELEGGVYMRNGPNPALPPVGGYHWFDGDGMVHATKLLPGGLASYSNHWVRTSRLRQEQAAGVPLFMKIGEMAGMRGLLLLLLKGMKKAVGAYSTNQGVGTANTALAWHAGRALALVESDMPYAVRVQGSGVVETLGRMSLGLGWQSGSFTAHPKIDARTGELIFFSYSLDRPPHCYCRVGVLDRHGTLTRTWAVPLPWAAMMHDMAITENYVVLLHLPMCFEPEAMVKKNALPFQFRPDRPSRIGLLRRDSPPDAPRLQWFELPAFMAFHVVNAWEDEEGSVRVLTSHIPEGTLELDKDSWRPEELQVVAEYMLDVRTGGASIRQASGARCDFPVVHPRVVGYPHRWAWAAVLADQPKPRLPDFHGLAKLDLKTPPGQDACVAQIRFPPGCYGGEATFVPRDGADADSDQGYLLVYVTDTSALTSQLHIYDAATMAPQPLAAIRLPQRVPFGFHGMFVGAEELERQRTWV